MTKSTDTSGVAPKDISQEVRDYCKDPKNRTLQECACINQVDEFKDTMNCAAVRINTCLTGKMPNPSDVPSDGSCATPPFDTIAKKKQDYDAQKKIGNYYVNIFNKCKDIYDSIDNASYGDDVGTPLGIGRTYVEFGAQGLTRFCGQPEPGTNGDDTPTYFYDSWELCDAGRMASHLPPTGRCCKPKAFDMNDGDAELGRITQLNKVISSQQGFVTLPELNKHYKIIKWTGSNVSPPCQCTNGDMDNGSVRPCSNGCSGKAQIKWISSLKTMCGHNDVSEVPGYNQSDNCKGPSCEPTFDKVTNCGEWQAKPQVLNCCINSVKVGPNVSGNINVNQVCEIDGKKYKGIVEEMKHKQHCEKNPDDPNCKKDCGPNPVCSGHGACVNDNDTGGKCKCGADRSGKYCQFCALKDSDCTTDNSYANQDKCICECKPGYIGSVDAGVCVKDEKNKNIFEKIIDWYNSIPMKTKIEVLSGVIIITISIITLIVMISKSKTSAKLILK